MKRISVFLLLVCTLLLTRKSHPIGAKVTSPEFKLVLVKRVTEVSSSNDGNVEDYINMLPEEVRVEICRYGIELVGIPRIKFLERETTGQSKLYILQGVIPGDSSGDSLRAVLAYRCPTKPATYIRIVDIDETSIYYIILKAPYSLPTFENIVTYNLKLAEDIVEADAEKILTSQWIHNSLYDTDELLEEQRLRMCQRAIRSAPDQEVTFIDNMRTGKNVYYVVTMKSKSRISLDVEENEVIAQAFGCPTQPKFYVYVNECVSGHNLWAIVKQSDLAKRPAFEITGYGMIPVKSINIYEVSTEEESDYDSETDESAQHFEEERDKIDHANERSSAVDDFQRNESEWNDEFGLYESEEEDWVRYQEQEGESGSEDWSRTNTNEMLTEDDRLMEKLDNDLEPTDSLVHRTAVSKRIRGIKGSMVDIDPLTDKVRRRLCENAVKAVSAEDVQFTDDVTGRSQYYVIDMESGWIMKNDIVEALRCPTNPALYLHFSGRGNIENIVWIIVEGEDVFEWLTSRF